MSLVKEEELKNIEKNKKAFFVLEKAISDLIDKKNDLTEAYEEENSELNELKSIQIKIVHL